MANQINEIMETTLEKIKKMMDANTIIGTPINTGEVIVIPVSKISMGYGSGGSDFAQKKKTENSFGGGAGVGVNVTPVAFLVVRGDTVKVLNVEAPAATTVDRVLEMIPDIADRITGAISSRKTKTAPEPEIVEVDAAAEPDAE